MVLRGQALALEPVRVVVELGQDEFEQLDRAVGRGVAPAAYLKLIALGLIAGTVSAAGTTAAKE